MTFNPDIDVDENNVYQKRNLKILYVISFVVFIIVVGSILFFKSGAFTALTQNEQSASVGEAYQTRQASATQMYLQTVNGFYIPLEVMKKLVGTDPDFLINGGNGPVASVTFPDKSIQDARLIAVANDGSRTTVTLVFNETQKPVPYYNPDGTTATIVQ